MDLLQSFSAFIAKENLFFAGDELLVAVSGGLDSVVLCELCHRAGYPFRMAHGNFQLRGEESERDEQFVRQLAGKYGAELFVRRFDTQDYAAGRKISIQVAARELRYAWFREIAGSPKSVSDGDGVGKSDKGGLSKNGSGKMPGAAKKPGAASLILTAHHLDDNIETLLMNFFKGTGIAGLHGILPRQGDLVRPLLFAGKEALQQFATDQQLPWVEDSSNQSDKYARNYLRQQVIPLVERLYPGASGNLGENIARFRDIEILYRQSVRKHKDKLMERKGEEIHIPVLKLKGSAPLSTLVYEIIYEFGFSPGQVEDVLRLLDSGSGKYVQSATHRILRNRNWLILSPHHSTAAVNILIESPGELVSYANGQLTLQILPEAEAEAEIELLKAGEKEKGQSRTGGKGKSQAIAGGKEKGETAIRKTRPIALFDAAGIRFPLLLRPWRQGDYFYPLGMRKKKKLGRFFIDNKLSLSDKEKTWVIEMDKKIIWVVGMRIDDRFRITGNTRSVLKIESRLA